MVRHHLTTFVEKADPGDRDERTNTEVAAILGELPEDHPVRVAFAEGKDTVALTHLVADQNYLVKRLIDTYFAHNGRIYDTRLGR
jgi:hypothetical protein